jgi:hypothetical protein
MPHVEIDNLHDGGRLCVHARHHFNGLMMINAEYLYLITRRLDY